MLVHLVLHALPGTLLFRDWLEARALWDRLTAAPGLRAAGLMPTHAHAFAAARALRPLQQAARSYALWRNARRGEAGPVWQRGAVPVTVDDPKHIQRTTRYIHLNPCREGLADDPLAWPFSTHRDAVGLAWPAVRPPVAEAEPFHRWVSADPSVHPSGSPLPDGRCCPDGRSPGVPQLRAAVSALTRTPMPELDRRGPARRLLIAAGRVLTDLPTDVLAGAIGVAPSTVRRVEDRGLHEPLRLVERVLSDPRFGALCAGERPWWRGSR
jgi:hypothetical protein